MNLLLKKGALNDINFKNDDGWSALTTACYSGRENVVELLIQKGADVNSLDRTSRTPLYLGT